MDNSNSNIFNSILKTKKLKKSLSINMNNPLTQLGDGISVFTSLPNEIQELILIAIAIIDLRETYFEN